MSLQPQEKHFIILSPIMQDTTHTQAHRIAIKKRQRRVQILSYYCRHTNQPEIILSGNSES